MTSKLCVRCNLFAPLSSMGGECFLECLTQIAGDLVSTLSYTLVLLDWCLQCVSCCSFTASLWQINLLALSSVRSGSICKCLEREWFVYFYNELFNELVRQLVSFIKPCAFINHALMHLKIIIKFFNDFVIPLQKCM